MNSRRLVKAPLDERADHQRESHTLWFNPPSLRSNPMTIGVRCGSCNRELLLMQLVQPSQGFRCLFCGFVFAPAYACLVTALTELQSMTGDRLRLDRAPWMRTSSPRVAAD
jgi:hypothetical protein